MVSVSWHLTLKCRGMFEGVERTLSLYKCFHMDTHIKPLPRRFHSHPSQTQFFFTKLRRQKANVQCLNRAGGYGTITKRSWKTLIQNQCSTWATRSWSWGTKWNMNLLLVTTFFHKIASPNVALAPFEVRIYIKDLRSKLPRTTPDSVWVPGENPNPNTN